MPKPFIKASQQINFETDYLLSSTNKQEKKQQMDKMQLDRLLRTPRSKEYMEALHKLDAGGHVHNEAQVQEFMDAIRNEFPEISIQGILLGFVAKCYLGDDYEVHTVDITGNIIEHYEKGQVLPNGLEKARGIAIHGGYEFIEVYVDCCRAISRNGTVSVIV